MTTTALETTLTAIRPADERARADARRLLDGKTKPRGSLGALEDLACRLAAIRGAIPPPPTPAVVVVAADHGVAREGVSAYPSEVTAQMLSNFASGGAAVAVLAARAGARLVVVDAGVASNVVVPGVRRLGLRRGTASFARGPAMRRDEAIETIETGIDLARQLAGEGNDLVAVGEMGIGNTTSAAAVCAALLGVPPEAVCGRGTGVDEAGLARKIDAVRTGLRVNPIDPADPVSVLSAVGGLEIGVMTGLMLGCAATSVPVLLDGAVVGAAALLAARLAPSSVDAMIAATRSPEPSHTLVLLELGLSPLLDLGLRLGEASGAALALPIVGSSIALLHEMATFEGAGVSDAGA
ncbi:MAG: nicotinate-nucleotide--dimethylbenzimidazole phosphoribosyltransferase [Actinomycetota bacterium]